MAATWPDETPNGYHLTENQTPTAVAGKLGNCASFDNGAAPDYLENAACPNIDWGGTYVDGNPIGDVWFWFKGPTPGVALTQVFLLGSI